MANLGRFGFFNSMKIISYLYMYMYGGLQCSGIIHSASVHLSFTTKPINAAVNTLSSCLVSRRRSTRGCCRLFDLLCVRIAYCTSEILKPRIMLVNNLDFSILVFFFLLTLPHLYYTYLTRRFQEADYAPTKTYSRMHVF